MFVHTVYFYLKPSTPPAAVAAMAGDCAELLTRIPSVRHVWWGKPAGSDRAVVDSTYQLGLCVVFDDQAGHDLYQDHPLHIEYMKRHGQYWQQVKVYDFV